MDDRGPGISCRIDQSPAHQALQHKQEGQELTLSSNKGWVLAIDKVALWGSRLLNARRRHTLSRSLRGIYNGTGLLMLK